MRPILWCRCMVMVSVGKFIPVDLREVWRTEDKHFTPWLAKNIEYLNDILDLNLQVEETEYKVGSFEIDILATESQGTVIIENQFGKSDHDHLGKIMTYLTNVGASMAIWICQEPRQEHIDVINELNKAMSQRFYMLGIKAYRIGDSDPAPMFNVVAAPITGELEGLRQELNKRERLRRNFWSQLLMKMSEKTDLFSGRSPTTDSWLSTGAGKSGISYAMTIQKKGARVSVYLDNKDKEENKRIFDIFNSNRKEIEDTFGGELNWRRMDDYKSSCIESNVSSSIGWTDKDEALDKLQDDMIDTVIRIEKAFKQQILKIRAIRVRYV